MSSSSSQPTQIESTSMQSVNTQRRALPSWLGSRGLAGEESPASPLTQLAVVLGTLAILGVGAVRLGGVNFVPPPPATRVLALSVPHTTQPQLAQPQLAQPQFAQPALTMPAAQPALAAPQPSAVPSAPPRQPLVNSAATPPRSEPAARRVDAAPKPQRRKHRPAPVARKRMSAMPPADTVTARSRRSTS
jgi:hypothetical protein